MPINNPTPPAKLPVQNGGTGGIDYPSLSLLGPFSANTLLIAPSTFTKITGWDTPEWDTTTMWDAVNNRAKPLLNTRTGPLHLLVTAEVQSDSGAFATQLWLYKNASRYKPLGTGNNGVAIIGGPAVAAANGSSDYFEIFFWHNNASAINVYVASQTAHWSVTLIPTN